MKKILILLCLICSMSASAETLKTDNPNRYLKNYVEECELLPMDYNEKPECAPYWEHWGKHSRGEKGTYKYKE